MPSTESSIRTNRATLTDLSYGMPVSLTATCPTCNANIADDDRTCGRCGAAVSTFPIVERTPLILPGNPALSADLVRARVRPIRVFAGVAVGSLALLAVLWVRSADDQEPETAPLARGIEAVSDSVASDAAAPQPASPASDSARSVAVVPSSTPVVAALPPIPTPEQVASISTSSVPVSAASAPASRPAVSTAPVRPTVEAMPKATPSRAAGAAATTPAKVAVAAPSVAPVLRLASLVSDSLRPGELLQLRWSVQDRTTGRAVPMSLEFTSADATIAQVDRRTGVVTAKAPGRVKIIADAGVAGTAAVDLWVRAAAPRAATVAAAPAESLQMRSEAARSVSTMVAPSAVRAPLVSAPPAAATRAMTRTDLLDADDVRSAVDRFVSQVRMGAVKNFELVSFFSDGAGHRVALAGSPATIGAGGNIVRVTFDVRLSKFDAVGRPLTRIAPISMDIEKRQGEVTSSAINISALRKP